MASGFQYEFLGQLAVADLIEAQELANLAMSVC